MAFALRPLMLEDRSALRVNSGEEAMQTTRHLESPAIGTSAAVGAMALVALLALPASAQTPSGIAGVVAPDAEPRLMQEGFVFTEGPVGTPDGGLYFSDIVLIASTASIRTERSASFASRPTAPTASR